MLVNKPLRWTSADVVKKIRNQVHAKVGHAGTLDPLATGLLILCTGKIYQKDQRVHGLRKRNIPAHLRSVQQPLLMIWKQKQENQKEFSHITSTDLEMVSRRFTGEIIQVPPIYSAIKKNGQRSYDLARQGKAVELEGRKVTIIAFEMQIQQLPVVSFRVVCSTGTYIRSLAHDVGQALGCGAYLSSLCRTRIGEYRLEDAIDPEKEVMTIKTDS